MDRGFRIGQVSKVDYKKGMVSVVYKDINGGENVTTDLIPYITLNGEYHMPNIEDYIAVLHLSNGYEAGLVLGRFWNEKNTPPVSGKDRYRKDFSNTAGKAYFDRDPKTGKCVFKTDFGMTISIDGALTISASNITFKDNSGTVTLAQIISHINSH